MQKEQLGPKSCNITIALLQIDFAENYTCVVQDEIQSFTGYNHKWAYSQYLLGIIDTVTQPLLYQDDLDHSKRTVIPYLDKIVEDFPVGISFVNIWSDGPLGQLKNRYIAAEIPVLQYKFKKKIIWNFFATSHGKGPLDGIGGAIKRQVWNFVKARKGTVFNAADFTAAAQAMSTDINVIEMKHDEIEEQNKDLNMYSVFEKAMLL